MCHPEYIFTVKFLWFNLSQQEALLEDLRTDIPVHFNFLFSDSHVEVISGKQEGNKTKNYKNRQEWQSAYSTEMYCNCNFRLGNLSKNDIHVIYLMNYIQITVGVTM